MNLYCVVFYKINDQKFVSVHKKNNIDQKFNYLFVSEGFQNLEDAIHKAKLFEKNSINLTYIPFQE